MGLEDILEEREKGHEARFKLEEEQRFKAESRRNRLLGLWAAERMGLTKAETEAYAREVVLSDLQEPGDNDVVGKVLADLNKCGAPSNAAEIRAVMDKLYAQALDQLASDFPDALGPDHEQVGG